MESLFKTKEYGVYAMYYTGGYSLRTQISIHISYYCRVCLFKLEE